MSKGLGKATHMRYIPAFVCHAPVLENGHDIRTVQELLGHEDVSTTTMINTHVLNRGGKGVKSPVDDL
jgi:site-specific recombinase XerD